MQPVTFQNLKLVQLVAMADGLVQAGHHKMAAGLYKMAADAAPEDVKRTILVRMGLASTPHVKTKTMQKVFQILDEETPLAFVGNGLATWLKTLPFYEDERFRTLAAKHGELMPMPNWHWNLTTVLWGVGRARQVEGDLVELGVFRGHTSLFAAEYVEFADWPKRWFLYDTFEGVPEDQLDPGWAEVNARMYGGTFSHEEVSQRFAHIPNIEVIKGRVPDVLAERCPERIAFLHMDLNSSAAETAALDALFDRITPGGVIVFDDYGWASARAQHDAENAWFAKRGLQILALPTGQGLYVK